MSQIQIIQRAIDYIETHLCDAITIEEVATHVCYSVYHFHRIFHSMLGCTVKNYIRTRRLTNAAIELNQSNKRVIDIAL